MTSKDCKYCGSDISEGHVNVQYQEAVEGAEVDRCDDCVRDAVSVFEELLLEVKEYSRKGQSERGALDAVLFANENDLSPAEQGALEEAVKAGATEVGRNADSALFFFVTEVELLTRGEEPSWLQGPF
jgi:ribosome-binding protein aMBF1 (putative translation factor)